MSKPPAVDLWGLLFNAAAEVIIIAMFVVFVVLVWFLWTFMMPLDAKTLFKSKIGAARKKSIILMIGDEGYARLYLGDPLPQGVINIGTKDKPRYILLPRPYISEEPNEIPKTDKDGNALPQEVIDRLVKIREDQIEVNRVTPMYEEFALKRVFWSGVNRPVYIAYSGKAVAVAPQVLAALGLEGNMAEYEEAENREKADSVKKGWFGMFRRSKRFISSLREKTTIELRFGVLLAPRTIKTVIPNLYTDAQLRKIYSDAFEAGKEDARGGGRNLVVPIMLIMIVVIIGIIGLKIAGVL